MSATYRITLVQLKADASAVGSASDKLEHGTHPVEEIIRLAGKLHQLDLSSTKAEPGIIVQRGDKGWRIGVHQGGLRMHKSMSLFDDFWTIAQPADIAGLPPFAAASSAATAARPAATPAGKSPGAVRTVIEAAGLFAAALVLIAVGLHFGLPQRRLSDKPAGFTLVTSASESATIFQAVAGSYSTGKAAGNSLVVITPEGQVTISTIGKDGKATKPRLQEQGRAGRQAGVPCVLTSTGILIAGIEPPEAVKVGNFAWRKAPVSVTGVN
jgi:hypothetical protein